MMSSWSAELILSLRLALAVLFAVAGVAKLLDRAGARQGLVDFGVPERLAGPAAVALPVVELAVAATLLPAATAVVGAGAALALLGLFTLAIGVSLALGRAPRCHCFGRLHAAPVSGWTLARNALFALSAGTILVAGRGQPGPSAIAWVGRLGSLELLALALGVLVALLVGLGGTMFLRLMRAYGRLLVRLDALERRLDAAGIAGVEPEGDEAVGLAAGTPVPSTAVADLDGAPRTLGDLLAAGRPLLLVFTSPRCGPCKDLLAGLAAGQPAHAERLTVVVASGGSREEARREAAEFGLERVLVDADLALFHAFQAAGTPSAVLVRADGTVGSHVAGGRDAIARLLDRALSPDEPGVSPALPVGAPVPALTVEALDGATVSLAVLGGAETLLLFWNPACGFCQAMRDRLLAWEASPPAGAPRLLVVSSGDPVASRADGFAARVLLDPGFAVGRAFGVGGTPMGVLVDAEGRLASPLAAGAEAVLALARGRRGLRSRAMRRLPSIGDGRPVVPVGRPV